MMRAIGIALLIAAPLNAQAISSLNPPTSGLADVIQVLTPASGDTIVPATGTTVVFVNNSAVLASLTVTFPPAPMDGQRFTVCSNGIITTMGFTGATGKGLASTMSANSYARFVWSASLGVWLRAG